MKTYPMLKLNDYINDTDDIVKSDMATQFGGWGCHPAPDIEPYHILIADMENGGYDSRCYFLLMHKKTKVLYEVEASH